VILMMDMLKANTDAGNDYVVSNTKYNRAVKLPSFKVFARK
jgi:hypothetical protein